MTRATLVLSALLLVELTSGFPQHAMAQSPATPGSIADNDGILIDGTSFSVTFGKAKTDVAAAVKNLHARELGTGAIVFRSGQRLYIVDGPPNLQVGITGDGRSALVNADPMKSNRIRIEYVPPENPDHQKIYEKLKARHALEMTQRLFSPFRLPVDLTIRTLGCGGQINAWYQFEESGPTVSICYEYEENIMRHTPMETTADGITREDAMVGQCLFVVAHEIGHALFDLFGIPVFGREEDAADQFAAYFILHLGKDRARGLIGGAAYAFHEFLKDYKENPKVLVPLTAFSSNHGSPEERYYNLLCIAYGADPKLFADFVETGMLPKTRAQGCGYEFKTLRHAVHREIDPHLDRPLSAEVWNMASVQ